MADNTPDDTTPPNLQKPGDLIHAQHHDLAANLIRSKIDNLYSEEPNALMEEAEVALCRLVCYLP